MPNLLKTNISRYLIYSSEKKNKKIRSDDSHDSTSLSIEEEDAVDDDVEAMSQIGENYSSN